MAEKTDYRDDVWHAVYAEVFASVYTGAMRVLTSEAWKAPQYAREDIARGAAIAAKAAADLAVHELDGAAAR